ncbi:MAG: hypothetical protein DWQ31_03210 [Planctomycetota bacterium]|nr:MAG: hypothetical protein DWQ31_03210 [Planctomycetota bacterium]REJ90009.1 MAG: hypothetical protein DWQ35_17500 [Planctomycetota bacterium]
MLTEILREGAQTLLVEAIEVEVAEWIDAHAPLKAVAEDILAADASPLNWRRLRRWDGPTRGNSQPREGRHG